MDRWQAVVFDLDDTLYPERDYVLSGFRAVAGWAEIHLKVPQEIGLAELTDLFEQGVRGDTFNRWLAGHKHNLPDHEVIRQMVQVYRQHIPAIAPFPGVPELLAALRRRYRLGLISDGWQEVQRRKMAALGLERFFQAVVLSDEWGREAWKPSAKPFEMIVQRLGVDPARTVYVGDNPLKDFLGCRRGGLFGVWVRRSGLEYTDREPPTAEHAPHTVIASLRDLQKMLAATEESR